MDSEGVGCFLQIETDPTSWSVDTTPEALAQQLEQATGPVVVSVTGPIPGRLLLSPRITTAWVYGIGGSHPIGAVPDARPVIYLPSITSATLHSGYPLDPSETLADLEDEISAAMAHNHRLIVKLSAGQLVLNGATLAFAVLAQAL